MTQAEVALAFLNQILAQPGPALPWRLDRLQVLNRIIELVRNPSLLAQRALNVCGPAVFFRIWFARDPVAAATFASELLVNGHANIGTKTIAPRISLVSQDYAAIRASADAAHANATPEAADWMLMSALRDSENSLVPYLGEPNTVLDQAAGITLPSTLISWLSATGLYSGVADETSFLTQASMDKLLGLIPTSNTDNILLVSSAIQANLFPSPEPPHQPPPLAGAHLPNHYVLLTAPPGRRPDWVNIECWSWGRTLAGWKGFADLASSYFGPVIATAP